jgi:hypothetical protein
MVCRHSLRGQDDARASCNHSHDARPDRRLVSGANRAARPHSDIRPLRCVELLVPPLAKLACRCTIRASLCNHVGALLGLETSRTALCRLRQQRSPDGAAYMEFSHSGSACAGHRGVVRMHRASKAAHACGATWHRALRRSMNCGGDFVPAHTGRRSGGLVINRLRTQK